jgi:hypothetical protein
MTPIMEIARTNPGGTLITPSFVSLLILHSVEHLLEKLLSPVPRQSGIVEAQLAFFRDQLELLKPAVIGNWLTPPLRMTRALSCADPRLASIGYSDSDSGSAK